MGSELTADLYALDKRISAAVGAVDHALSSLSLSKDDRELARRFAPLAGSPHREVAGQAAVDALREAKGVTTEHRDGLLRWAIELTQSRIGWDLTLDLVDAAHAEDPTIQKGASTVARSYDEAHRALVAAVHPTEADQAITRLDQLALPVLAVRSERRARRFEVARRLGLEHPASLIAAERPLSEIERAARAILDQTEDLASSAHKDTRRRVGMEDSTSPGSSVVVTSAPASAGRSIWDAFARDAREGWPAHLGARWLEDVFSVLVKDRAPTRLREGSVSPIGAASFLRAATRWGYALRLGATPRSLPYGLARDPFPIAAIATGHALAIAISGRPFAKRKLGLTTRSADTHARVLHRAMFLELRRLAVHAILSLPPKPTDEAPELATRLFGAPLPGHVLALWAYGEGLSAHHRSIVEETAGRPLAELLGALEAFRLYQRLVDRYDEDWFDNPKAAMHLASVGAGPVWAPIEDDILSPDLTARVVRSFEEELG